MRHLSFFVGRLLLVLDVFVGRVLLCVFVIVDIGWFSCDACILCVGD